MRDETHAATRKFPSKKQTRGSLSYAARRTMGRTVVVIGPDPDDGGQA